MSSSVLPGIQYLRAVAVVLVVCIHADGMMRYPQYFGASPFGMVDLGLFGVGVFFVISGFVIAIVTLDAKLQPKMSVGQFGLKRFLRIVPFMWLCAIGYNALSFFVTHSVEWGPALRGIVLWPVAELKPNVLWTLRHEFIFYTLFALTMLLPRRFMWLLVLWFLAPLALLLFPQAGVIPPGPDHPNGSWGELAFVVLRGSEIGANLQFGTGFLLGILWMKKPKFMHETPNIGLWLILFVAFTAAVLFEIAHFNTGLVKCLTLTVVAGVIVWMGIVAKPGKGVAQSTFNLIGNASYAIYLVHNPILLGLLEFGARYKGSILPDVFWAAAVIIAIGMGTLVHLLIEAPMVRYLTARFNARRVANQPIIGRSTQI
jgi:exopolysaccharide production protein ExoZ